MDRRRLSLSPFAHKKIFTRSKKLWKTYVSPPQLAHLAHLSESKKFFSSLLQKREREKKSENKKVDRKNSAERSEREKNETENFFSRKTKKKKLLQLSACVYESENCVSREELLENRKKSSLCEIFMGGE